MRDTNENLVHNRLNGRLMKDVFGARDGEHLQCADYSNADVQNAYYKLYLQRGGK